MKPSLLASISCVVVGGALLLVGCSDDKSPNRFDCDCDPGEVCIEGRCVPADVGGDAGDMGGDFVDNPDCPGSGVVISELVYTPVSGEPEWVEIRGPVDRDLTGFRLVGINGNGGTEFFNVRLEGNLGAAGRFVIASDAMGFADAANEDLVMQNGPDNLVLQDCVGQTVDAIGYGNFGAADAFRGEGSPAPSTSSGESLARCPGAADTNDNGADFHVSLDPTPNDPNDNFEDLFACAACDPGAFEGEVVVNEVLFNPDGSDTVGNEFVELRAQRSQDLFGLRVEFINGSSGDAYMRLDIASGSADADGYFVIGGSSPDADLPGTLQNGPDAVRLVNCSEDVIDAVGYGNFLDADVFAGEGAGVEDPGSGNSVARCGDSADSDDNGADFNAAAPSPGAENTGFVDPLACGGTTCLPDLLDGRIVVNEMVPGTGGFIELRGDPNIGIGLAQVELLDADGTSVSVTDLSGSLDAVGLASVSTDDLSAAGGSILLLDCEGDVVDALAWGAGSDLQGEGTAAAAAGTDQGLGRCPGSELASVDTDDNATDFKLVDDPTRGAANDGFVDPALCGLVECVSGALTGQVVVNELLPNPDGTDTVTNEFIELRGATGLQLSGATLELINGNGGTSYETVELIGAIPDDGLFVIGGPEGRDAALPGTIQNGPDSLRLLDCEGVEIDAVAYGTFEGDEIAVGEGTPAPGPGSDESIARCAGGTLGDIDSDDNATDFQIDETPTPGADNTGLGAACGEEECVPGAFSSVVINEVLTDSGGFVELIGDADLALEGATVTTYAADGSSLDTVAFVETDALDGSGFFSVDTDSLSISGGSVVLTDCDGSVVDAAAWGTGEDLRGEGTAAPAPSLASHSVARCVDGVDSDDNDADFGTSSAPTRDAANGGFNEGTCGAACNDLTGIVIINEINPEETGSDSGASLSFVELRGVADTALDGAEIRLRNGSSTGGNTSAPISLDGQTIPGDGLWVVGEADVLNRDLADDGLNIQNGPDNIVLVDGCGNTVDAVAYGTFGEDNTFEGEGTAVATPSDDSTLGRRPSATLDEADTDDNSADFCVITPASGGQAGNAGLANPDPAGDEMTCPGE